MIRLRLELKTESDKTRQERIIQSNLKDLTDFLTPGQLPSTTTAVWRNYYASQFMTEKGLFAGHRAAFVQDLDEKCNKCDLNEIENRNHILFRCPHYSDERRTHLHALGISSPTDLRKVLTCEKTALSFTDFCKHYVTAKSKELNRLRRQTTAEQNRRVEA